MLFTKRLKLGVKELITPLITVTLIFLFLIIAMQGFVSIYDSIDQRLYKATENLRWQIEEGKKQTALQQAAFDVNYCKWTSKKCNETNIPSNSKLH